MDPEQRLWFIEQTMLHFLCMARWRGYIGFENAYDPARFVDLEITDSGVALELGLCEYTRRHLGQSPAASTWLAKHGWRREESDPWSCYRRHGVLPDGVAVARLVEAVYIRAYELPFDFAVIAVLEDDAGADAIARMLNEGSSTAWVAFAA
jgi:hypothetical protein